MIGGPVAWRQSSRRLICTVGPDGHPHAARAWGLTVVDGSAGLLRVLAEAGDAVVVAGVRAGDAVAVTATRVPDFYSVQLKDKVVRDLTAFQGVRAEVIGLDRKHPNELLVGLNVRDRRVHVRHGKVGRHHSQDTPVAAFNVDEASNQIRICAEALPETMAHDENRFVGATPA